MPTFPAGNRKASASGREAGFTLLEVAAALLVACLGLVAVMRLGDFSDKERILAQGRLIVLRQARTVMNEWMTRPDLEAGVYRGLTSEGWRYEVRVTLQEDEIPTSTITKDQDQRNRPSRFNPRSGVPRRFALRVCLSPGPHTSGEGLCLTSGATLNKVD